MTDKIAEDIDTDNTKIDINKIAIPNVLTLEIEEGKQEEISINMIPIDESSKTGY